MNTSSKILLKIENIYGGYGEKIVIKDISLEVKEGETLGIIGKSGSGKTTLLNIIAGLAKPLRGKVILDDEDITEKTGKVSYMLQKDLLLPFKTVAENIALPLIIRGEDKNSAIKKILPYFEEFGLKGYDKKYPSSLSGGMRQRAALLRTYMSSGKIMILDEPFSSLDYLTRTKMHHWYKNLSKKLGLSTIIISHDIDEILKLSDRLLILKGNPANFDEEIEIKDSKKDEKIIKIIKEHILDTLE